MTTDGVDITGPAVDGAERVLTPEAITFVLELQCAFYDRRREVLDRRRERQERLLAGELPAILPETEHVRAGEWTVAEMPEDMADRRVEITGPADRKMIINALNSGAKVFWRISRTRTPHLAKHVPRPGQPDGRHRAEHRPRER
jgi:malate synthase